MDSVVAKHIFLQERHPEWLVALPPEPSFSLGDPSLPPAQLVLVYRFFKVVDRQYHPYMYEFVGTRILGLPNNRLQSDASQDKS